MGERIVEEGDRLGRVLHKNALFIESICGPNPFENYPTAKLFIESIVRSSLELNGISNPTPQQIFDSLADHYRSRPGNLLKILLEDLVSKNSVFRGKFITNRALLSYATRTISNITNNVAMRNIRITDDCERMRSLGIDTQTDEYYIRALNMEAAICLHLGKEILAVNNID